MKEKRKWQSYKPEELKKLFIKSFCLGSEEAGGMRVWDVMALHNVDLNDKEMEAFIIDKLKARDMNTQMHKRR